MGFVSEDRGDEGLAAVRSVADNLTLSRLDGLGSGFLVSPTRQDRAALRWIDALEIRCRGPRDPVRALSGGNQQKVAIARLLHHDVDVWLLDEPTRGIDVASKAQIYGLIDRLVSAGSEDAAGVGIGPDASRAKAVLLVSSYLPELLGLCDRIAVMSRGELGSPRPVSEWTEHSLMMAVAGVGADA